MKRRPPQTLVALLVLVCQLWSGTLWASHVPDTVSGSSPGAHWTETHDSGSHDQLLAHCDHCCHGHLHQVALPSSATGTQDLHLRFTGGSGSLFNVNWWQFAGAAGGNLLTNGTAESGTTGWRVFGSGSLSSDTSVVHGGARSLAIDGRTAAWNGAGQEVGSQLVNGRSYTTGVWVRTRSGATTAKATLAITANGSTSYVSLTPAAAVTSTGWTLLSNPYASSAVRIQTERSQRVISKGPYGFVRHPMYLGVLLISLGSGPALGSWWSSLVLVPLLAVFVARTLKEDRMLQHELDGYRDYAARVRWRVVPGLF